VGIAAWWRWVRGLRPKHDAGAGLASGGTGLSAEEWEKHLSGFQQGDVLSLNQLPILDMAGGVRWEPTPNGVVIVTQTCDVVRPERPNIQLCPVVERPSDSAKRERHGSRPSLVHLPAIGDTAFADLNSICSVNKEILAGQSPVRGAIHIADVRKFGQRVGRRFSRFAFPDAVTPWLKPLQDLVEDKQAKVSGPAGWALQRVASLRLACASDWVDPPYDLTLWLVMEPGVLPEFEEDEVPEIPGALSGWLAKLGEAPKVRGNAVATRLMSEGHTLDAATRYWLWSELATCWAALCQPASTASGEVLDAVAGGAFESDIASAEQFSFEDFRNSEEIDLDHLSGPYPK